MKLGLMLGYSGAHYRLPMDLVLEAERLGFDSVWTAEAWGSDAITPLAFILARTTKLKAGTAIIQVPARTPACAAMTAMTLDQLSGGRFLLGVGASGPQVVEGWHGVPYGKPVTRVKEYVSIIRQILAREGPLTHEGPHYQIPYHGAGATGLGKPLKSILHGNPALPIYVASITPTGVTAAAEVGDGFFPVWMNPDRFDVFESSLEKGFAKAGNKTLANFDVAPFVRVSMGDDLEKCRQPIKENLALYIGGMGARNKNFYNDYASRLGFEGEARAIQDAYLSGDKATAVNAVPDALVDECALIGSPARIRDQLQRWQAASDRGHVGTMIITAQTAAELQVVAEAVL